MPILPNTPKKKHAWKNVAYTKLTSATINIVGSLRDNKVSEKNRLGGVPAISSDKVVHTKLTMNQDIACMPILLVSRHMSDSLFDSIAIITRLMPAKGRGEKAKLEKTANPSSFNSYSSSRW